MNLSSSQEPAWSLAICFEVFDIALYKTSGGVCMCVSRNSSVLADGSQIYSFQQCEGLMKKTLFLWSGCCQTPCFIDPGSWLLLVWKYTTHNLDRMKIIHRQLTVNLHTEYTVSFHYKCLWGFEKTNHPPTSAYKTHHYFIATFLNNVFNSHCGFGANMALI